MPPFFFLDSQEYFVSYSFIFYLYFCTKLCLNLVILICKGGIFIYQTLQLKSQQLNEQIHELQNKLQTLPSGKLVCCDNRDGTYKWYHSDGHTKVYIPKKNRHLAEQLATKKYLTLQLEELLDEKKSIDFYLKHRHTPPDKATLLITEHPEYANLLAPYFTPTSQELKDWASKPFEHNPQFPEHLIHKSSSGHLVRSKSETLIDTLLYINQIPFRYESALYLGETVFYPDFTIRHPKTGETYYWEHFGLMDDAKYAKNSALKLQVYSAHGIIPTIHLITTYETKDHPLSSDFVEKIIQHYFL